MLKKTVNYTLKIDHDASMKDLKEIVDEVSDNAKLSIIIEKSDRPGERDEYFLKIVDEIR